MYTQSHLAAMADHYCLRASIEEDVAATQQAVDAALKAFGMRPSRELYGCDAQELAALRDAPDGPTIAKKTVRAAWQRVHRAKKALVVPSEAELAAKEAARAARRDKRARAARAEREAAIASEVRREVTTAVNERLSELIARILSDKLQARTVQEQLYLNEFAKQQRAAAEAAIAEEARRSDVEDELV